MNMKTIVCVVTVLLLSLTAATIPAATTDPTTTEPATVYRLKWNGYYAANTTNAKQQEVFFMDRATKLSKGRIQWEYYPSLQLGSDQLEIIGSGTAQAGVYPSAFSTGKLPLLGVLDLPFLYKDTDFAGHIRVVTAMFHQQDLVNAFAKFNIKILAGSNSGTLYIWAKKPLKVLADFKGLKIRASGALQSATFSALGATAQSLQPSEVYMALASGVVDATVWGSSAWDNKVYEVTKYCVIPPGSVGGNTEPVMMNLDTFNKLPKDLQDVLVQAGSDEEAYIAEEAVKLVPQMLAALAAKGMDIYTIPNDEIAHWRTATQPVYDKWLMANGAVGQRVLDFALQKLGEKK